MTTAARREQMQWRKCAYCGKLMSFADMDNGIVKSSYDISSDGLDYGEPYMFHVKCHEAEGLK